MSEWKKVEFIGGLNAPVQQFYDNIAHNVTRAIPSFQIRRAMLVGGGPSAADHLAEIRDLHANGWSLWTVNGAHDWLVSQGIVPDYCTLLESNEVVNTFVRTPVTGVKYFIASQCHPSIFDRLIAEHQFVCMWHAGLDAEAHKIIELADPDATIFAQAQTTGLHSLALAWSHGIKRLNVYGMDSSHRPDRDHAYDNSQQADVPEFEFRFEDKVYRTTPTWANQAQTFARMIPAYFRLGMRIEVKGDGLLPDMARKVNAEMLRRIAEKET